MATAPLNCCNEHRSLSQQTGCEEHVVGHCTDGFITSQCSELKWDSLLALILPSLFSLQDVTAGLLLSVTDTRMMISAAAIE